MSVSPEELKRRAQAMLDAADGKPVQSRALNGGNGWALAKDPIWNWFVNDYRIAPEPAKPAMPRRCWAWFVADLASDDKWGIAYALNNERPCSGGAEKVQLIELTPEVSAALLAAGIRWEDAPEAKGEELPEWVPPLPEGAVLLGWGDSFITDGDFQGWAAFQKDPKWELRGNWAGTATGTLYAAPADSEIAKLNGKGAK